MKKIFSLLMMAVLTTAAWAGTWDATPATDLVTGDVVVIAETTLKFAMTNDKGTSAAPVAEQVAMLADLSQITSQVPQKLQWVVTVSGDTLSFKAKGTNSYLYCTNTNRGVFVGTTNLAVTNHDFTISDEGYLYNYATGRYVGIYNNADWRCYTSINANIQGQEFAFYKLNGEDTTVATPVITLDPAEGPYYVGDEVNVNITCATEGATISYSVNDSDWTEGDNFDIAATSTIKAKAELNGVSSEVATMTVNFVAAHTTVSSVAEFNELSDQTELTFNGTLTALAQTGKYLFAQDAEKGILIYGTIDQTYQMGDQIPGGFTGKKTVYNGAPEMINPAGMQAATTNVAPTAVELTPAEVTLSNFGRYAVIRGASVMDNYIVAGSDSVALFTTRFGVNVPTTGSVFDIYGIVSYFNGNQFMPLEFVDVTPAEELVVTFEPEAGDYDGPVTVTITCNNPNALITYALNDGDDVDYTEPFTLYQSATVTAFATDGEQLVEASATYNITLPAITATFTPAAGTYYTAQNVKVDIENTYGETVVAYYLNGEEVEYDAENGIAVAESATIKVEVMDEYHADVAEFTAEYVITQPDPLPASGTATIVFADNDEDSNTVMSSDDVLAYITEGAQYVASVSDIDKIYQGVTGIKFSSSKVNGTMTINFTEAFPNVKTVEVEAENWHNASTMKYDVASINDVALADSMASYIILNELQEDLASLTITATNRAYVKSITITWGEDAPAMVGDLNGDNKVDVIDVNLLINAILNDGNDAGIVGNPDLNGSGNVDIEDLNTMINIILAQ